jgi:hypothetical protein
MVHTLVGMIVSSLTALFIQLLLVAVVIHAELLGGARATIVVLHVLGVPGRALQLGSDTNFILLPLALIVPPLAFRATCSYCFSGLSVKNVP